MLCVLERTIASDPTNESAGDHFLSKAFVSGTPLAKTEVVRWWLRSADAEVRRAGNALLISARGRLIEGRFLHALALIQGQEPFDGEIAQGLALLRSWPVLRHFDSLFDLALFRYQGVPNASCRQALHFLHIFL
jgi:hypothetical protein